MNGNAHDDDQGSPNPPHDAPAKDSPKDESTPQGPGTTDPEIEPPPSKQIDTEVTQPPTEPEPHQPPTGPGPPQPPRLQPDGPLPPDPPIFEPLPPATGNLEVHSVPEPGTLGLVALGFAALGLRRRRSQASPQ